MHQRSQPLNRRLGYRLLPGEGYAYILHLRPREWAIVAAHLLFGFLIAIPEAPREVIARWPEALFGAFLFVVLLNGGTLAINSAFDRDSDDIGYLDAPPPPPRHLLAFALGLMALGQVAALLLPRPFALVYAVCFLMSVLYSVPPFRWKAIAGLDLLINAVGFGTFTALAGWTLAAVPIPGWAAFVLLGFLPLFAALYPLTQLYQFEEDRARGDRTLALALGVRGSLRFSLAMVAAAFVLLGVGLSAGPAGRLWLLILLPLAAWSGLLLRWHANSATMSRAQHKRGMYRALNAWALTDAAVLAAVLGPLLL